MMRRCSARAVSALAAGVVALLWATLPQGLSADTLRCPRGLVVSGDPQLLVLRRCGEPDQRVLSLRRTRLGRGQWIEVPVETWFYDFGYGQLLKRLVLENGVLTRVEVGPNAR